MLNPQDAGMFTRQAPVTSASSAYIRNPKHMPLGDFGLLNIKTSAAVTAQLAAAGSFTTLANGGAVATLTASDTYVTVCDIAGAGFLTAVIGALGAGPHTPTFQITVDGIVYVIASSATITQSNRMMLGSVAYSPMLASGTTATTIAHLGGIGSSFDEGFVNAKEGGLWQNLLITCVPTPHQIISLGLAKLRFDTSLKVEVKDSTLHATTDPNRKVCALYLLDL